MTCGSPPENKIFNFELYFGFGDYCPGSGFTLKLSECRRFGIIALLHSSNFFEDDTRTFGPTDEITNVNKTKIFHE